MTHPQAVRAEAVRLRAEHHKTLDEIAVALGLGKSTVRQWIRGMRLPEDVRKFRNTIRKKRQGDPPEPAQALPFSASVSSEKLRAASIGVAIDWFASRGYRVSIPMDGQSPYDIIVEADSGRLLKIQIKTTNTRAGSGRWIVQIQRAVYSASAKLNAAGRRYYRSYTTAEADYIFVVTGDRDIFIIPVSIIGARKNLTLDSVFANFKV